MKKENENVSRNIMNILKESVQNEKKLQEAFIYKNAEDGSTINLNVTDDVTSTSVGEVIPFEETYGKIAGFVKVNGTTYLITKYDDTLLAFSVSTDAPFEFNFEDSDEFAD